MFIKPIDLANLSRNYWTDHAGNTHFTLQSKKKKESFLGGVLNGLAGKPANDLESIISNYEYRIILKLHTRNQQFVVAVDESFSKIRENWNWIEVNLYKKVLFYNS